MNPSTQPTASQSSSQSSRRTPAGGSLPPSPRLQRHKRLLTRVTKNPRSALRDRRCLREPFLGDFFQLCHGKALEDPESCLEYADVAVELAAQTGDRCRIHRAHGIHVHALIANRRRADAAEALQDYRVSALACCPSCASDWHLRHADLAVERFNPGDAAPALDQSLEQLGPDATPAERAERCFIRCIQHHFQGAQGEALADASTVLRDLDLSSPQGYFLDTLGFIACFLQRSRDPNHDQQALATLADFRQRLRDAEGFSDVRTRLVWVEGQVYARLNDWRRAHDRLGKTQKDLARAAPPKHVLAVALDRCQLYAGRPTDATRREILRSLKYHKTVLDLGPGLKKRLKYVIKVVSSNPRHTVQALSMLRRSYIVPVPGIVARFG